MAAGMETHSLDLSEEDQLQIALAISAEEQQLSATEAEDARLARQLQEAEYAQAQAAAAGAAAVATAAAAGAPNAAPAAAAPQHAAMPMPAGSAGQPAYASTPGMASSSSGGLVDSLRVNAADAMQRIGSGSQQLWTRLRRQVGDAQPPPPPPPYYQQPLPHLPPPYYAQPAHHQPPYPPPTQLQHGTASCVPWQQAQQAQQAQQPPRGALNEDEALALALQRQFDLEDQYQQQQPQQQHHQPPPPPQPQPGAMQPGRVATGPLGAGAAAATAAAAAAAGAPSVPARHGAGAGADPPGARAGPTARPVPPTSSTASQPAAAAAAAQPAQRLPVEAAAAAAAPSTGRNRCAGCGGSLFSLLGGSRGAYIQALGRHWHPGCLVCGGCRKPIGSTGGVSFTERDGLPYHIPCFKEKFHPKCSVCHEFIPEQGSRRIVWNEVPFWRQRYCPSHEGAAPRCAGCSRLRPYGEDWAELEDQRQLCLSCLDTITTDTRDAQPLWQNVLAFYAELGLPLPVVPPMMLVDSGALNDAEGQETHGRGRGGGPVFHVRGLTLTEEYASIRTILRIPGGNPFAVQRESVQVGPTRCEVTGILVLYGLPRLLTGSILAHEVMHAYLRMAGCTRLEEQVEEGLAQLMALLWLEAQAGKGFKDEYEERLAAYLGHQIRSDTSPIYGDGFRMAHEAFQVHGLERVLHHVRQTGTFPPC